MKRIFVFLSVALLFNMMQGCKPPRATSYTVHNYLTDNGVLRDMLSATSYISDEQGIVEFRLMSKVSTTYVGDELKESKVSYDTIAVLYLDPRSRRFYEIDTFSVTHKLIRRGKYSEKEKGVPLRDTLVYHEDEMIPGSLRDTVIDGKNYKVINAKTPDGEDGRKRKTMAFFDEKANFNSIMSQVATMRSHRNWTYVAAYIMDIESGDAFLARIEDIKPASKEDLEKFKAIRKTVSQAGGK